MQRLKTKQNQNRTVPRLLCVSSVAKMSYERKVNCAILSYKTTRQDTEEMPQDIVRNKEFWG